MLIAVLTQLARVANDNPDTYPVPWAALYGLSAATLAGIGAKKIIKANSSSDKGEGPGESPPTDPVIPTTPTTVINGNGHEKAS